MTPTTSPADDWSAVAEAWDTDIDDVEANTVAATEAWLGAAAVRPGDRLLELAAGPGTMASEWSRLVGPAGRVVISDVAPGMVTAARRRNAGLDNVEVVVLDAARIDRPDRSFDVVVSRMGLMFTPDPAVAFREIRRVLAGDGRFAALTWAGMAHNPWMTCVGMAAMVNGLVAGGPPDGPGGVFSLGDPAQLAKLADDATLRDVTVEEIPVAFHSDSIDSHLRRVSTLAGPLAAVFQAATPEQLEAVRQTAAQLAADHIDDQGVTLPGRALLVTGRA